MFRSIAALTAILGIALVVASPAAQAAKGKVYGDGVKLAVATPIEKLLANPQKFVGKEVRVDGVVTGVCAKAGCWMELSDAKTGKNIRFKVEDGVIVFPLTARGRKASAAGTFERLTVSPEEHEKHAAGHAKHDAEHKGEQHAGEGDTCEHDASYRIRATGAVIY